MKTEKPFRCYLVTFIETVQSGASADLLNTYLFHHLLWRLKLLLVIAIDVEQVKDHWISPMMCSVRNL